MRVSRLTASGDWTLGRGRANYARGSEAVRQNVVTRLRSFTNDWFLDISTGLPWEDLLGNRNMERRILREVERTVLATVGVRAITRLRVTSVDHHRAANIELSFVDIFDTQHDDVLSTNSWV